MPWRSGAGQLPVRPRPTLPKCMSLLLSLVLLIAVAVDVADASGCWLKASACDADAAVEADACCSIASAAMACSYANVWSLGL